MKKFYSIAVFLMAAFLVNTSDTFGQVTWDRGAGTNNWGDALNWSTNSVPTASSNVVFPDNASFSAVKVNVNSTCGSITIAGGTNPLTITVNSGITLTVTNSSGGTGVIDMGAPTDNTSDKIILLNSSTSQLVAVGITMAATGGGVSNDILNINAGTATFSSSITMNGSSFQNEINMTSGKLVVGGTISSNATGLFTIGTGTVEYNGAAQVMRSATYNNLTLSGSGSKTTAVTVNGKLSVQGTATVGSAITYGGSSTLEYKGSAAQTTTNNEFPASIASLTIDNPAGVTLNAAKSMTGNLTLTNGYLTTSSTNLLSLSSASTATSANGAFINGPLLKNTGSTSTFTFPVGKVGAGLRNVGVTPANASASSYTAEYFNANPKTAVGSNLGTIDQISSCEYWDVARASGAGASITLSFLAAGSNCGSTSWGYIGNTATLLVAHFTGGTWVTAGNAAISGTPAAGGTITSTSQGTFSPFTLGTSNGLQNPLPVKFANVKAFQRNAGVQVEWTNLTEKDVLRYTVERSSNGISYSPIAEVNARGNQNNAEQYASYDASPVSGTNFYRVTAVEITGKTIYSTVMKVDMGQQDKVLNLYPNPVKNHQVNYTFSSQRGLYTVSVYNSNGQVVFSKQLQHDGGAITQMIELPASVKTGVYSLKVSGDGFSMAKPFIVQ